MKAVILAGGLGTRISEEMHLRSGQRRFPTPPYRRLQPLNALRVEQIVVMEGHDPPGLGHRLHADPATERIVALNPHELDPLRGEGSHQVRCVVRAAVVEHSHSAGPLRLLHDRAQCLAK